MRKKNNMGKIVYYTLNGDLDHDEKLNTENLAYTNGMMIKCYMEDNSEIAGFADPFRTHDRNEFDNKVHDYINLWTWDNLDELSHKLIGDEASRYNQSFVSVSIDQIKKVEAILHSNPRFGTELTNKFFIKGI